MPTPHAHLRAAVRAAAAIYAAAFAAELPAQPAAAAASLGRRFPALRADALSGREYELPRDFAGRANVVFIAYERGQQRVVDTWVPFVRELSAAASGLRYYELPTIARRYRLMSPIIANGMRGGVTEPAQREATITLYTDVGAFRRALGLETDDTVHVLVLDAAGVVRWRADGAFDAGKGAALRGAVAALLGAAPGDPAAGARR